MRLFFAALLASTSLCSAKAFAASAAAIPAAADATDADAGAEIIVTGRGETRQVQKISQDDIAILAPGTSTLKALDKLPSVNFQSADPFGTYEWSERITVRGFDQSRLGFTLDGIPLGNQNYGNNNGLHTSRAISSENVATTRLTQGAGSVAAQATNNLGGNIEIASRDPSADFGIDANASYGNHNTGRGFVRVDTGGSTARAWLSYGYLGLDKWKGDGRQYQHQVNAKGVIDAGPAKITGFFNFSDRREQDYQDLSLDQIKRLGYNLDNLAGNFPLAVLIADVANNIDTVNNRTGLPGPDGLSDITGNPPSNAAAGKIFPSPYGATGTVDDSYYDASGLRRDYLGSLGVVAPISDKISVAFKGYYHNNHGQGTWFTPYVPSPTGVPISVRTTEYDIKRKGAFGDVKIDLGWSNLTVGAWYERNNFHQARRFYALGNRTTSTRSALNFQTDPFFTQWEFDYTTDIYQYYVQDKIKLDAITIDIGWKGFNVKNSASPVIQGGRATGSIKATDWFQPSIGINYQLNDTAELYASFSQSTEAYVSAFTAGPFSTTQAGFDAIKGTLKPESSNTFEVGSRFKSGGFNGTLGAYLVNFNNRLLGITTGAGIVGNPAVLQNVGGVRSVGIEAAGNYRFGEGFNAFLSYSYNSSTYRNNVINALGVVLAATAGKNTVDAPRHLIKAELGYDSTSFFGRVGVNYMSKRFFTYLNDQSVPGRALVDATLGYRFNLGGLKRTEIQLNATNLLDKQYISTIGSNGFGNSGDNQTLLTGAPLQILLTLKFGI
jgi:iron complex outermembrane recepter protein